MNSKIVLCAFLYLCVQVNGETVNDVIAELQPKVNDLQNKIGLMIGNDRHQLGLTRDNINVAANAAQNAVNLKLNDLNNIINGLENEAAANPNVQACVNSAHAALNGLDMNGIRLCRQSRDLDLVGVQLRNMGNVNGQLGSAMNVCSTQNPVDAAALRNCIEGQIAVAELQSSAIDGKIRSTLDNAAAKASDCINSTANNLNNGIDKIVSDLQTCVSSL